MTRFLVRLSNSQHYTPKDVQIVSENVRKIIGSKEKASHFRIGARAIEFNLFANTDEELDNYKHKLESNFAKILLLKSLDSPVENLEKNAALREGIEQFNEERFWEANETLELAWKQSEGREKESIQGLILIAAGFVHQQKNEQDIALSIFARARTKLSDNPSIGNLDLSSIRNSLERIIQTGNIVSFKIS